MTRYETILISDPDIGEDDRNQLFEKTKELISKMDGFLVLFDEWGNRKLAYEVKKKMRGYYVLIDYCGTGELVSEIERSFKIDDRAIKFMTVVLDKYVDVESLKAEIASAEEEKEEEKEEETKEETKEDVPESDSGDVQGKIETSEIVDEKNENEIIEEE